jgi:hypothetical protein
MREARPQEWREASWALGRAWESVLRWRDEHGGRWARIRVSPVPLNSPRAGR